MTTVSSRFATLLGQKKLKISEVHRKTGISRTTLTKLYYGEGNAVSYTVLAKLCAALNCEVSDILEVQQEADAK